MGRVNFKPKGDYILTKVVEVERRTASGIILPTGEDDLNIKFLIDVGGEEEPNELIVVTKYAGIDVELDGISYVLIRESDILGTRER